MQATRHFAVVLVLLASLVSADERLGIPGLKADVEILTDRWGIDHIDAENEHDLFFAQGYASARNRLFQIELWRRQATGTVAEILGRRELDRDFKAPSLRYFVHLHAPGWNVIGGGEPVLPGISIGHNEYGGWGLTVFGQDNEDLYVYDTNPSNPNQYRHLDAWEDMRIIEETIAIRDESPETVELKYTRHGPVLYEDRESTCRRALRMGRVSAHQCAPEREESRERLLGYGQQLHGARSLSV